MIALQDDTAPRAEPGPGKKSISTTGAPAALAEAPA